MSYFTIVICQSPPNLTNEWNEFSGVKHWHSMTRGVFATESAARERAKEMLPPGALYAIKEVVE